jgi:sarcosine oxidase delta subunit
MRVYLVKYPNCGNHNVYEFRFGGEVVQSPAPQRRPQWEIDPYLTMF